VLFKGDKLGTKLCDAVPSDIDIARLIGRHYGDGGVYLTQDRNQQETFSRAISGGFVSREGFLTRKGRQLLAQFNL
jgi:hypothetical protein